MKSPENIVNLSVCPSCGRVHQERLVPCPLCDRQWNQGVIGNLGVFDGLPVPNEENPDEDYGYAALVTCGCGFNGPSRATCRDAISAWNKNAGLIRLRIETGVPIDPNNVIKVLQSRGILQKDAA